MPDAIVVQGLGKQFCRYHADRPVTLKEACVRGLRRMKPLGTFWALRDVTFRVSSGRMVGVIGRNGAGKSTLLRLIGGVGRPDEGHVTVNGRIGALLDLGAGFQPDLTGRDNVFINGVIAGLTRREVARRFESIVDFAELENFIDSPLRTYSTGMKMRLGFAVAAHVEPEILLIDEVLAVGDLSFQRKCLERIARLRSGGCAILLVSHDTTQIRQLCEEALWLRAGRLIVNGHPEVVVGQYVAEMSAETQRRTPVSRPPVLTAAGTELRVNENRFGSLELEIVGLRLLDPHGFPVVEVGGGDPLLVEIEYYAPRPIHAPIFGVTISRDDNLICFDTSTQSTGLTTPTVRDHGKAVLHLERLDLIGGEYYVDVGIYERDWTYAYDYHWHVYPLRVRPTTGEKGVLRPPHRWDFGGLITPQADPPTLEALHQSRAR
jgi:lipopolysaccharide transport system ATP-binding protein